MKAPLSLNKRALRGTVWLAADIHLGPQGPHTAAAFYQFLEQAADACEHLILVGDIFNAWIGDEQIRAPEPWLHTALQHLQQFSQRKKLYLVRGNRDFLIGKELATFLQAELLPDQLILRTDAFEFLLMHGDELCTDDHSYQRFRRIVRHKLTQALFYSLSLKSRQRIANFFRKRSKAAGQHKTYQITDVNAGACLDIMLLNNQPTLIHGHTHRPTLHHLDAQHPDYRRIVLPDWEFDHSQPPRAGWLSITNEHITLHRQGHDDLLCDVVSAPPQQQQANV